MEIVVKKHPKTSANEAFIDGLMVGFFEQMTPDNNLYSFMLKCSHDKLIGDHYILIGQQLNKLNKAL